MGKISYTIIISIIQLLLIATSFAAPPTKSKPPQPQPQAVRAQRSLPSVSNDHYQELGPDGTYRYAYTGVDTYHAEKRLSDGTVEGETLVVRPDGVPVKVHYFADNFGYRPQTEVLYAERVISEPQRKSRVLVQDVYVDRGEPESVVVHRQEPTVVLAPPPQAAPVHTHTKEVHHVPVPVSVDGGTSRGSGINVKVDGSHISIGGGDGGRSGYGGSSSHVAAASPSITAIIGPGGHAELRPETVARSGYGGTALSSPTINAVVGAGGSAVVAPSSRAYNDDDGGYRVLVPPPPAPAQPAQVVATRTSRLYEAPPPAPPPQQTIVHHHAAPARPAPAPPQQVHVVHHAAPAPAPAAVIVPAATVRGGADTVVLVPPSSKYSYTYSYSAPDGKHPQRDNSAFVSVNVNH